MSPTVFRYKGYQFFFFSLEEKRMHIHVRSAEGEAKFWVEPKVELQKSHRFTSKELKEIAEVIEGRRNEIIETWKKYFKS